MTRTVENELHTVDTREPYTHVKLVRQRVGTYWYVCMYECMDMGVEQAAHTHIAQATRCDGAAVHHTPNHRDALFCLPALRGPSTGSATSHGQQAPWSSQVKVKGTAPCNLLCVASKPSPLFHHA